MTLAGISGRELGSESKRSFPKRKRISATRCPLSGARRVLHALLGETGLGCAGQFIVGRLGIARHRGVLLAFLHEAGERGARELLCCCRVFSAFGNSSGDGKARKQQRKNKSFHCFLLRPNAVSQDRILAAECASSVCRS